MCQSEAAEAQMPPKDYSASSLGRWFQRADSGSLKRVLIIRQERSSIGLRELHKKESKQRTCILCRSPGSGDSRVSQIRQGPGMEVVQMLELNFFWHFGQYLLPSIFNDSFK